MLTPQERLLVSYLAERERGAGGSTFREMIPYAGTTSLSVIARMLDSLEGRGYLRRMRNRASAIEILREPEGGFQTIVPADRGVVLRVPVLSSLSRGVRTWETDDDGIVTEDAWIPFATSCRTHFGWRNRDASMIGIGVVEGDLCVMVDLGIGRHRTMTGSVVLAQMDGGPLMLRRITYGGDGSPTLESVRDGGERMRTTKRRIRVLGRLVSSMRICG